MMRMKSGAAVALAAASTALMIYAWGNSALWILNWALIFPAWFIALLARSAERGAGA
jgi:hypothetical protein